MNDFVSPGQGPASSFKIAAPSPAGSQPAPQTPNSAAPVTSDPNSPSTTNINPHQGPTQDSQTNALAGLAEILSLGNNNPAQAPQGNPNQPPAGAENGSQTLPGAGNNQQPNQQPAQSQQATPEQTSAAITQLLNVFKGDALYEHQIEDIATGLSSGDLGPLTETIDAAVNAGIARTLDVVLNQIAPGLIEAAVTRSVDRASDTISANNIWTEFAEANPVLAKAESIVRPQLEMAYRNTGDRKKAMEAIVAVYGASVGGANKPQQQPGFGQPSAPFSIEDYFGG